MKIATRPGRRVRQVLVSLQIAILVVLAPSTSLAVNNLDRFAIGFDVVVLRPLGAIRLAVGAVALIPVGLIYSLKIPLDGGTGALQEVAELLVVEPANFFFRRPLGEDLSGE
ncbi:MAG: hypothetical protein ABGX04_17890 [Myxococcales bacterium]|nr:hypothetical protein [Myxococcales bacterium]HIK84210.1 hypothetical protein [Myxococcales bacterium]